MPASRPFVRWCALFLLGSFFVSSLCAAGQTFTPRWDKTFGGAADENFYALQPTADGGYLLGGHSNSGISGERTHASRGTYDYWVVKIDASGAKLWDQAYGGTDADILRAIAPTSDGGYLLGGRSYSEAGGEKSQANRGLGDYWVVKIDANGNKLWDRTYGGDGEDQLMVMHPTPDGGYLLGGYSGSDVSGEKTQPRQGVDFWVVKIDATGAKLWDKTFGGVGISVLNAIAPTPDGGYLLGGESSTISSTDKSQPPRGNEDMWVIKIDNLGNKQWDRSFGGSDTDRLKALQPTPDGGCLLGGYSLSGVSGDKTQPSKGGLDQWLVKIDAAGNKLWDKAYGGDKVDYAYAIQPTADGNYLLGGLSSSTNSGDKTQDTQGGYDYWVVKVDANGNKLADATFGGSADDFQFSLQPTNDGNYVMGGHSNSGLTGTKTQPSRGGADYWVMKFGAPIATATTPVAKLTADIYPNPALGNFRVRLPASAPRVGLRLSLVDATGRTVLTKALATTDAGDLSIEVGPRLEGLYLLRITGPRDFVLTHRLVLQ
jgi:hypothetical protein